MVHLVIWEVQDSGFKIKGAFFSEDAAKAKAGLLNALDKAKMITSTERHIKEHPESVARVYRGPQGERLSHEEAIIICRASCLRAAEQYCIEHSVYSVKVL